jgi:hypothetical protein
MYEEGTCKLFNTFIPSTLPQMNHRICSEFKPDASFSKYLAFNSLDQRFSWFGRSLQKGKLYVFPYNNSPAIKELKDLSE